MAKLILSLIVPITVACGSIYVIHSLATLVAVLQASLTF